MFKISLEMTVKVQVILLLIIYFSKRISNQISYLHVIQTELNVQHLYLFASLLNYKLGFT